MAAMPDDLRERGGADDDVKAEKRSAAMTRSEGPATRQIHAGYTPGELQNTVTVPVYQSAAY